jgi:hypothetical protein
MNTQINRKFRKFHCILLMSVAGLIGSVIAQEPAAVMADSIILKLDFENHKAGEHYGPCDVKKDFGTSLSLGSCWPLRRVKIDSVAEFGHVLRVHYPKNKLRSLASGASWKFSRFHPRQEAFLSYWVFFPDSFEFRAGGKLHGLVGGKGNTGGKKPNGHDGWSCRVHWGEGDLIKLYVYHKDQGQEWGDTFFFTHRPQPIDVRKKETVRRFPEREIHVSRGKWHHIQIRVKVNAPGYRNGLAQAWFDGEQVADVHGFEFRSSDIEADKMLINAFYFSTFFGGRGEHYRPVKDETILFDQFVLSKTLYRPKGVNTTRLIE